MSPDSELYGCLSLIRAVRGFLLPLGCFWSCNASSVSPGTSPDLRAVVFNFSSPGVSTFASVSLGPCRSGLYRYWSLEFFWLGQCCVFHAVGFWPTHLCSCWFFGQDPSSSICSFWVFWHGCCSVSDWVNILYFLWDFLAIVLSGALFRSLLK